MNDTLEQAFADANEKINSEQEAEVETKVEEPEPKEETEEVVTKEPSEDKSESFTKVNPDELPDELKGVYKSLQADYTRKTQDAAKTRKESAERVEELEKRLAELEQPSKQQSPPDPVRETVKQEIELEKVKDFRDRAISDYESADPRLKINSEGYDKATDLFVGQEMDELLAEHVKKGNPEYSFDYNTALETVLGNWDSYVQSKNKEFLEKQQKQAEAKTKKVNKSNPKGKSASSIPKKPTLDEALSLAAEKL